MAIRKTNPTSAGRRGYSYSDQSDITTSEPFKKLLAHKSNSGGRNNHGRITSRFRGGDRIRSQPDLAHRAASLRRRR
jgi:large subunit ribosomal protein L2